MRTKEKQEAEAPAYEPAPLPSLDSEWARLVRGLAAAIMIVVGTTAIGAAWTMGGRWPVVRPFALGLALAGLVLLAMALVGAVSAMWGDLERLTGRDLDQSGAIGDDPGGLVLVRARNSPDADTELHNDLTAFLAGCVADTSARRWEPHLGRVRYQQWRDMLIDGGWARWRSTDQRAGWELTASPDEIGAALG